MASCTFVITSIISFIHVSFNADSTDVCSSPYFPTVEYMYGPHVDCPKDAFTLSRYHHGRDSFYSSSFSSSSSSVRYGGSGGGGGGGSGGRRGSHAYDEVAESPWVNISCIFASNPAVPAKNISWIIYRRESASSSSSSSSSSSGSLTDGGGGEGRSGSEGGEVGGGEGPREGGEGGKDREGSRRNSEKTGEFEPVVLDKYSVMLHLTPSRIKGQSIGSLALNRSLLQKDELIITLQVSVLAEVTYSSSASPFK